MPSLDIVIVNWNSGSQLRECLRSIQALPPSATFRLARCVVVDNASTDGSASGLEQFPFELVVIRNAENLGFGAASNRGASAGEGELILFLNPDCRLLAGSLGAPIAFLEEPGNLRVGLVGIQLVDEHCQVQPSAARFPTPEALVYQMAGLDRAWPARFPPFLMTDWDHKHTREVEVLQGAFLLMRRTAFRELRGFDEHFFMYYEDVDLAYRGHRMGWSSWYLATAKAYHRGGGTTDNIKAERLSYWMISRLLYARKHFGRLASLEVLAASLTIEPMGRLVSNVLSRNWRHLGETVRAYGRYLRAVPRLLRA